MKNVLSATAIFLGFLISAQIPKDTMAVDSLKNWSVIGKNSLTFNQASFSNWIGGGSNNIGWIGSTNYSITYEKQDALVENIIILKYGQNKTQGFGMRKTDDVINISTNFGLRIAKNWYASAGTGILTQFSPGYENGNDPAAKRISNFFAPAYLNMGAGFTYRPDDNLTITLRPANARWTFVLDEALQNKENYGLLEDGDSVLFQFGFMATAKYRLKLVENVSLLSTGSVFSNYLDHPERLVLSYSGILDMKINKFMSAIATAEVIYDHDQVQKVQIKQTLGIGLVYKIEKGRKRSENNFNRFWK